MSLMRLMKLSRGLNALHNVVKAFLRWIALFFGVIPRKGRLSPFFYSVIHYVLIIGVTLVLAWYSPRFIPESRVPISNWFVQRFYVAIQFVLFYLFVRLLIAAIRLIMAKDVSEFEDIDRAFDAGLDALAREGFDLHWLPVFLIAGPTPPQRKSLFDSTRLQWKVTPGDDPTSQALSFYACDEAIFICLNEVGALSRQLDKPAISRAVQTGTQSDYGPTATLRPGQIQAAAQQTRRPEQLQSTGDKTLAPGALQAAVAGATMPPPRARFGETIRPGEIASAVAPAAARPVPLEKLSQDELRLSRRRMEYFCQRLTTERGAYCPINGLLQVLPVRWTQSPSHEPLFAAPAQDVQTLHSALNLQFPVVLLHAGLEDLTGLPQFLERGRELDSRFRDSRAGSRFPAGQPIDEKASEWVVERGVLWFRDWVYAEFAKNLANPNNRQLYQFLCSLSERRGRLVRELRTVMGELKLAVPVRLSGYYFAATGDDAARKGFVHGVMQRLMSEQNDVAWSPEWRSRNRRAAAMTLVLFVLTLAVLAGNAYLGWKIWQQASLAAGG
jgi:hypothetical protein